MKLILPLFICLAMACCGNLLKKNQMANRLSEAEIESAAVGTPKRISGAVYVVQSSSKAGKELMDLIKQEKTLFKLETPAKELTIVRDETDNLGFRHLTLDRMHRGVPLWNEQLLIHINPQNEVYLIQGDYSPSLPAKFKPKAKLSKKEAEETAKTALAKSVALSGETKLWVLMTEAGPQTVWRVVVGTALLAPDQWECLVSATNGDILKKASLLRP
jgi:bacillolysin